MALPGTHQQTKGQIIKPSGEQHFLASKQVFEAFKRQQIAALLRTGQELDGKNGGSQKQDNRCTKCNRLRVFPVGGCNQQQPGKKNQNAGVPVKGIGSHFNVANVINVVNSQQPRVNSQQSTANSQQSTISFERFLSSDRGAERNV